MSYQEYAQLGKGTRRKDSGNGRPRDRQSDLTDRPYHRGTASFSVPRPSPPHSSSSSTSSATLSPSNSASQKDSGSPTVQWTTTPLPNQLSLAKLQECELGVPTEKKPNLVDVELPWRPPYLRRRILAAFVGIFAAVIVALEVLGDLSNRNAGLGNGDVSRRTSFAWTYLPILGLTILGGMWTRVDYQAKVAAPWIRMSKGPAPAEKTLLLDYVNMALPMSMVRAILNRDVVVACTSAVSLHLGVLVVLSTALLTLSLVGVPRQNTRVMLHTAFMNDPSRLAKADSFPFLAMVGLQQDNLSYPDGVSSRYAYQQFSADVPLGTEIRATVDGFSAGLDCTPAILSLDGAQYSIGGIQLNTTFSIPDCSIEIPIFSKLFLDNSTIKFFSRFSHGGCDGSNRSQDQRIVVVFGSETVDGTSLALAKNSTATNVSVNATIPQSRQFICKPTYAVSRLNIQKHDTTLTDLDLESTESRTLSNVGPWDIAQAFFDSYQGPLVGNFTDTSPSFYPPGNLTVDPAMYLALGLRRATVGTAASLSTLFDRDTLQSVAQDYFQQYAALISSRSLVEETDASAMGTIMLRGERLVVRALVVQLMVALLGMSLILTVVAMGFVPRKGFLPRDPNTIIDTAALIAHSRPLLQSLRGAGGGSDKTVRDRLSGNKYSIGVEAYEHGSSTQSGYFKIFGGSTQQLNTEYVQETEKFSYPINLHPVVRIASFIGVLVVIVLLEVTLRASQNSNGLTDVMNDTYSHLLWTAMPALVISRFATYFASVDFTTRALAPYVALKDGSPFHHSVSLNYLDKTAPVAIYEAIRNRNLAIATGGLALLASSLFVVLAAPIFSEVTIPATATVRLLSQDFFSQTNPTPGSGACSSCQNGTVVSSLILSGNLSYPAFTYRDLNFPSLTLDTSHGLSTYPDDVTITASLQAIRPSMACRMFTQSELDTNFTLTSLHVDFRGETGSSLVISTGRNSQGVMAQAQAIDTNAFFGASAYSPLKLDNGTTVPRWIYAWGQLSNADSNQTTLQSISGMSCNESVQQVTAMTTLYGSSLTILPSDPPVVDESSAIPVPINLASGWDYSELATIQTPHLLDSFFSSLVTSRYAIPVSSLADSSADRVASAITTQHNLIRTQVLNLSARRPITSTSTSPIPIDAVGRTIDNNSVIAFSATATSTTVPSTPRPSLARRLEPTTPPPPSSSLPTTTLAARRRLSQSPSATRVLQSALAATLLLSVTTWLLSRNPAVHPRPHSPNSVASVAALLADGNTFGLLGRGAEWSSTAQLRGLFMDGLHVAMGFRMGWDAAAGQRRRRRLGDEAAGKEGGKVFGVSAVRTGGWGGGEGVGLGLQARVGYGHRRYVGDWGWRT